MQINQEKKSVFLILEDMQLNDEWSFDISRGLYIRGQITRLQQLSRARKIEKRFTTKIIDDRILVTRVA